MSATVRPPKEMVRTEDAKRAKNSTIPADRQALIEGLNHDLAGEYQAILMYVHYSAKITGPYRRELRALFQTEIADEQGHAQFLADKIVALGGDPTTSPRVVPSADQPRLMLEQAVKTEEEAIVGYGERIRQAEAFGDIGLKVILENQVADETRHKEELQLILAGWDEINWERTRNEDRWQDDGGQG
jgi:bacterioferritin